MIDYHMIRTDLGYISGYFDSIYYFSDNVDDALMYPKDMTKEELNELQTDLWQINCKHYVVIPHKKRSLNGR